MSKKIIKNAGKSEGELVNLPTLEESDIDATIRANVIYLREQFVLDAAEARLEAELGSEWMSKVFKDSSPQKLLDEVERFRFHLEQIASEVTGIEGWHFQKAKIEELPRPTTKWLSSKTGLSASKLEALLREKGPSGSFGGVPFKVSDLIKIANALNTTIQFLMTPQLTSILVDSPVSYYKGNRRFVTKTSISQWHLWLHALAPLPEQNFYLFEKHGSHFAGYRDKERGKNAKPTKDAPALSAADIQFGPLSAYSRLNDYKSLRAADKNDVATPIKRGLTHAAAEQEILAANLGLFVELRKLTRKTNLALPEKDLAKIFESGFGKAKSLMVQIVRNLKYTQTD